MTKKLLMRMHAPDIQDWLDIDFAIAEGVDFIAVSFVKTPDVMNNLKSYCGARSGRPIEIIAKIESFDSVPNLQDIVEASDGVMVARGDLGAQQGHCSLHLACCSHSHSRRDIPGGASLLRHINFSVATSKSAPDAERLAYIMQHWIIASTGVCSMR